MKDVLLLFIFLVSAPMFLEAQDIDAAREYLYYNRLKSAENELSGVLEKNPSSDEASYLLSQVYLNEEEKDKAQQIISKGIADLYGPLMMVAKGQLLLSEGKSSEARALFEKAIEEKKKKNADVLYAVGLANVKETAGDPNYAISILEEAAKKDKKNPNIYLAMGDAYRRLVNGGQAVVNYQKAYDVDHHNGKALYKIGRIYETQKNPEMYVKYFEQAIEADPQYADAYYELYLYYYYRDVYKARNYLNEYIKYSDPSPDHQYMLTDLLYVSEEYQQALTKANEIIDKEKENVQPRIYKLKAYSYAAMKDTAKATPLMQEYLEKQPDTLKIAADFAFYAALLDAGKTNEAEAISYYERAISLDTLKENRVNYMQKVAAYYKEKEDKVNEAKWLGRIYTEKDDPSNVDLFNWGLAAFMAQDFQQADSAFGLYTNKYPDQLYGYYWRARTLGAIDSTLELGSAVPQYEKVLEIASQDPEKNKNVLIQTNSYLAVYQANTLKNYEKAIAYLDNILQLDPGNKDAEKNKQILEKQLDSEPTQ